ncbi:MAG: PQQ-like beta-propeller repeat protein [Opitutales bacterium]|nr:PQQ-like beta-propeller repeat protein [Opitutales bacterium]
MTRLIASFAIIASTSLNSVAQNITDPNPPTVNELKSLTSPDPISQSELTFHQAPKPLPKNAITEDWMDFLGPTHNAISRETSLLSQFGENGPNIVWEVKKGEGYAAPAVIEDRLILFHRQYDKEDVECHHTETGQRFWKQNYPSEYRDRYGFGNGPRCQPISDGEFVYTLGVEAIFSCWEIVSGQLLWQRDLKADFDLTLDFFGVGATPLIEGDLIIVNIGASNGPCVAAFDKRTGAMIWGSGDQWGPSYASPIPANTQAGRRIFVFAGGESRPATGGLLVIDPANGHIDCRFPWRGNRYESVNASSPVVVGNRVYISECYGAGGAMLEIGPNGTCSERWNNEVLNTHFMTAIHKDGYLYGIDGHGPRNAPIVCIELETGKEIWRTEPEWITPFTSGGQSQEYNLAPALASFLLVDGRCLVLGQYGHLAWIELNPDGYKELDRTHLFLARQTWALPTISRGLLYVVQNDTGIDDSDTRLICYDLRAAD